MTATSRTMQEAATRTWTGPNTGESNSTAGILRDLHRALANLAGTLEQHHKQSELLRITTAVVRDAEAVTLDAAARAELMAAGSADVFSCDPAALPVMQARTALRLLEHALKGTP